MVEYAKYRNERAVFLAIKRGTYPKPPDNLVPRTLTIGCGRILGQIREFPGDWGVCENVENVGIDDV